MDTITSELPAVLGYLAFGVLTGLPVLIHELVKPETRARRAHNAALRADRRATARYRREVAR